MEQPQARVLPIVIGFDGSEPSMRALEWAFEEARLRHASVRVVHAWSEWLVVGYVSAPSQAGSKAIEDAARRGLEQAIATVGPSRPGVSVEPVLVHGAPEAALLHEAQHASIVVVGTRGHGGFAELVLGSVAHALVHHAPCPVAVVR